MALEGQYKDGWEEKQEVVGKNKLTEEKIKKMYERKGCLVGCLDGCH